MQRFYVNRVAAVLPCKGAWRLGGNSRGGVSPLLLTGQARDEANQAARRRLYWPVDVCGQTLPGSYPLPARL